MSDVRSEGGAGDDRDTARAHHRPSTWHRLTAGLGLLIVLSAFAFLIYDATTRQSEPYPVITVEADTVIATQGGFVVRVRARNTGGGAAASLHVQGELHDRTGAVEIGETTIDYVPPSSVREAGLIFASDPRRGRLVVRAVGFDIP